MRNRLFVAVILLMAFNLSAQNLDDLFTTESKNENTIVENVFRGTKFVNSQSANLAEQGVLILDIQHRFGSIRGGAYEFFGLDQADMRLGFEYGLTKNLNIGLGRSTFQKTYDTFLKAALARQSDRFPIAATFTASGYFITLRNYFPANDDKFTDKLAGNFQFQLVRNFNRLAFQVSPGYLFPGYLPGIEDSDSFASLGGAVSVAASRRVNVNIEYIHFFTEMIYDNNRPLSLGVDIETGVICFS